MRILLAREIGSGRFEKVLVASFRQDGTGSLPLKWNGTLESRIVRNAGRFFAAESAAREQTLVMYGTTYRVTRVD